jgi:putative transposase
LLVKNYRASIKRCCGLLGLRAASFYYKAHGKDATALILRLKELAAGRCRFGYMRLYELLRREGWKVNHKRIYRLYRLLGLQLRIRRKTKRASHLRVPLGVPETVNEQWTMDFVEDRLENGRRFRMLTVVDKFSRECPLIAVDVSFDGRKVIGCLELAALNRKLPSSITVDNGTEFYSRAMDSWAYQNNVRLDFIRPGKPVENAFIESFNGKLRDECLNTNVFFSIEDAKRKIEAWRIDYNTCRPHSSVKNMAPAEYAESLKSGLQKAKILNPEALQFAG